MSTENSEQVKVAAEQRQQDIPTNVDEQVQYKRILLNDDTEENTQAVDFRRVQHSQGPCACCGPHSE